MSLGELSYIKLISFIDHIISPGNGTKMSLYRISEHW